MVFFLASPHEAHAQSTYTAPSSCTGSIGNDGLVVDTVYCIQQSISSAVYQFITLLEANLQTYQYAAMAMVFAFFGIKLVTGGVDETLKESSVLLLRMGWAFILIQYATWLYPIGSATMDELIGWVTDGAASFTTSASTTCTALTTPPFDTAAYGVWHQFDCMLKTVLGATTTPTDILQSMATVIIPSLVSTTLSGIAGMVALIGVAVMLFMLLRALYTVLLSYLTLGVLIIFTPLVAPLLYFNSAYCKDLFDKWLGLIMSTLFQPMFVMGFLAFAIQIEDALIDGNTGSPAMAGVTQCTPPQFDSVSKGTETSPGSGSCTWQELYGSQSSNNFASILEFNATRGITGIPGDPQRASDNGSFVDPNANAANIKSNVVGGANQYLAQAAGFGLPGHMRLTPGPSLQFGENMVAFALVSIILYELMEIVPEMARSITLSVGVGFRRVLDPVSQTAMEYMGKAKHGAMDGLTTKSGQGYLSAPLGAVTGVLKGATRPIIGGQ